MDIDSIFKAAVARKNKFTAAQLSEDLGVDKDALVRDLKELKALGIADNTDGSWSLTVRRTAARDRMVAASLSKMGEVTRDQLNASLPGNTPAQVYTSLQRLIVVGRAQQKRDGSRTPRYASV